MLTTEIKVNGVMIAHLYIHNEGMSMKACKKGKCGQPTYKYWFEYVEFGQLGNREIGTVEHCRKDGASKLIELCLKEMHGKT